MSYRSCLYQGQVYHRRSRPKEHKLRYSVFSLFLDLAEIDRLDRDLWLFSRNRFNFFAFHDRDFGDEGQEDLTEYVRAKLQGAGITTRPTRIFLSCYPRVLGYMFNPLSLFYCMDNEGRCIAVVHEVHNTFGERHCYVLPVERHAGIGADWIHQEAGKKLFVSPFAHMSMHYNFRLNVPGERQIVIIRVSDEQGVLLTASYVARQAHLTTTQLSRFLLTYPLLGVKVILGIHWEALKLWSKGVPWFKHQPKSSV